MNKLQKIEQMVNIHMAAKEEYDDFMATYTVRQLTSDERQICDNWLPRECKHAAMQLLADVMPLLVAAVEWDYEMVVFEDYVSMEWKSLETKVAKLLEEVEE